jgi:glycosyltransferase involved in cell wall biosynthesis
MPPIAVSIIVPVYNNPGDIRDCLAALVAQARPDMEILVVDDASTDETPSVVAELGAGVLRLPANSGPAAARNHGARQARGDILLFVDADVVVERGTVDRVLMTFAQQPELAAVFGSYDAAPRAPGVVSRYRNLLHHFVHQNGHPEASTFWAGCGAIRRAVFHEVGGFDERRFPRSSIEDIELGHRLRRAGHRILLDKTLQATHLKRWSLASLIRTDVTRRAIPWSRLVLDNRAIPDTLNLARKERVCAALVAMAGLSLPLIAYRLEVAAFTVASLVAVLVVNRKLHRFFLRRGGPWFVVACIALHLLYYVYSGLSFLYAWLEHGLGRQAVWRLRLPRGGA